MSNSIISESDLVTAQGDSQRYIADRVDDRREAAGGPCLFNQTAIFLGSAPQASRVRLALMFNRSRLYSSQNWSKHLKKEVC